MATDRKRDQTRDLEAERDALLTVAEESLSLELREAIILAQFVQLPKRRIEITFSSAGSGECRP
ncbi:MAG TPA: hypothetical protein VGB13_00360 [Candidatus Krumholzibacteria bacterium]